MNNTTTAARPHIVWLDALRFVAILMVIACHVRTLLMPLRSRVPILISISGDQLMDQC